MDSTKSPAQFARALALVSLAYLALPGLAAPVVAPVNVAPATSCSLDITLIYTNENSISSDLPSDLKDILSSTSGFENVEIVSVPSHVAMRDIRFHHLPEHEGADHHEEENKNVFMSFLKLTTPAAACPSLPLDLLVPSSLASLLDVTSVVSFFAVPTVQIQTVATGSNSTKISGIADVLIADFADGSYDKWAEVTTDAGETFLVGGPDSDDAVIHAKWTQLRSGDSVELEVESQKVGPSADAVSTGMGMGQAYTHAQARHRLVDVARHTPKSVTEDKTAPKGVIKVIAIRMKFTDSNPDAFCTESCVTSNIWTATRSVDGVYREASYGIMSVPQTYGKVVTVTLNVASTSFSSSNLNGISAAADAAVASQFPSINLSSYTTKVYMTVAISGIGIAYLGSTPGRAFVHDSYPDTIAHEVGHTLGMQHSNRDPGDDNTVDEYYGDRSCIMGYSHLSLRSFNVMHRIENGWIPSTAVKTMPSACGAKATSVRLTPLSKAVSVSGATVAVKVPRTLGGNYFVSFRNGDGYDGLQTSTYRNKVVIHYQIAANAQTQLVVILSVGQSWTSTTTGLTISVSSISSTTGAVIKVSYCSSSKSGEEMPVDESAEELAAEEIFDEVAAEEIVEEVAAEEIAVEAVAAPAEDDVVMCGLLPEGSECSMFSDCASCTCSSGKCM